MSRSAVLLLAAFWLGWQLTLLDSRPGLPAALSSWAAEEQEEEEEEREAAATAAEQEAASGTVEDPIPRDPLEEARVTLLALGPEAELVFDSVPLTALDTAVLLRNLSVFTQRTVAMVTPPLGADGDLPDQLVLQRQLAAFPLVLGCVFDADSVHPLSAESADLLPVLPNVAGDPEPLAAFNGLARFPDREVKLMTRVGFTAIDFAPGPRFEADWVSFPLLARHGKDVVPSFALQVAADALGIPEHLIYAELGQAVHLGNRLSIPIDAQGFTQVPWRDLVDAVEVVGAENVLPTEPDGGAALRYLPALARPLSAEVLVVAEHDPDTAATAKTDPASLTPGALQSTLILGLLRGASRRPLPAPAPEFQDTAPAPTALAPKSLAERDLEISERGSTAAGSPAPAWPAVAGGVLALLLLPRRGARTGWAVVTCAGAALMALGAAVLLPDLPRVSPTLFASGFLAGVLHTLPSRKQEPVSGA